MSKATQATKNEKAAAKASKAEAKSKAKAGKVWEAPVKVLETVEIPANELILTDKFRGRSAPVSDDEVKALAEQLIKRQDQPIQVRRTPEGKPEVIFGNTRTRAGQLITKGFTLTVGSEGKQKEVTFDPIPDFKLRAEVVDIDDEEAILRNLTENVHRTNTTAIDDAQNHEMLRTEYGMSDAAITRLYGYAHQASVTQLKKLLTLPDAIQSRIHTGAMTKNAGFLLADYCKKKEKVGEDGKCDEAFCDSLLSNTQGLQEVGGIGAGEVQEAIKAYEKSLKQPTPEGGTATEGTAIATATEGVEGSTNNTAQTVAGESQPAKTTFALTMKDFKDAMTEFAGLETAPDKVREHCTMTLSYLKGEVEKDAYYEWLTATLGE